MGATTTDRPRVEQRRPPIPDAGFRYVVNPLVRLLLRSPLHGLASDAVCLLTYTGRKSGREYTIPVGYERPDGTPPGMPEGDAVYVTSGTDRVWWRNLQGGAEVTVRVAGERWRGFATVTTDDAVVADYVEWFADHRGLDQLDRLALSLEGETLPDHAALAADLADVVVVRVELEERLG